MQEPEASPFVPPINVKADGGMPKPQKTHPQHSNTALILPAARKWLTLDNKVVTHALLLRAHSSLLGPGSQ